LGQPRGIQRSFLDEGKSVSIILQRVAPKLTRRAIAAYAASLLRALPSAHSSEATGLPEPLSPQEQRVLRLLVAGLSNPEIATQLVVSPNTIKTHIKNIYRKLNVSTRDEVRDAAHELNLL